MGTTCPGCAAPGQKISQLTLTEHTDADRTETLDRTADWRHCRTRKCSTGYFSSAGETVQMEAMLSLPFAKGDDPQRLVCFCFEHRVAAVAADARRSDGPTLQAEIAAACRAGQDDCERQNPAGRCCLGNVGAVVAEALGESTAEPAIHCCGSPVSAAAETSPPSATAAEAVGATVIYKVSGMTCGGCAAHAVEVIERDERVASVNVSYADGEASVVWRAQPDDAAIAAALDDLGYSSVRKE
jgi:copper chaperone CopZ